MLTQVLTHQVVRLVGLLSHRQACDSQHFLSGEDVSLYVGASEDEVHLVSLVSQLLLLRFSFVGLVSVISKESQVLHELSLVRGSLGIV